MKFIRKLLTKNAKEIPILFVLFNERKYKESDKCFEVNYHPSFRDDEVIKEKTKDLMDYIKENYDLGNLL